MKTTLLIFATFVALGSAKIASIRKCNGVDATACKINQVRISPCGPGKGNACFVDHEQTESLSFDFTPNFATSKLQTKVYWANGLTDLPFDDMKDVNGCSYTTCPTEIGKQQTFTYSLFIDENIPPGRYAIKWKVWNEDNDAQVCCFETNLRISDKKNK